MKVFNASGEEVGMLQEKVLTFLPKFEIYLFGTYAGCIKKEFTFLKPVFDIDYNGWHVQGDFWEWDYKIVDASGRSVATVSKELLNFTDTYSIDIREPKDALATLMLVLAIDAEKCSRN